MSKLGRIYRKGPPVNVVTTNTISNNISGSPRIAIVQGGAWGDNINSTLMFKPIKAHYPNCRLDVHTSTVYGNAFHNNPLIDNLLEYQTSDKNSSIDIARSLPPSLRDYDIISAPHPMFNPDKWSSRNHQEWGENLIFAWVRAIEDMSVPYDKLETILQLTQNETANARNFVAGKINNILMEIHGDSGQTFWNPSWTMAVGAYLCDKGYNLFISHKPMRGDIAALLQQYPQNIHWAGNLSIRECAEVFNHCVAFISVSSGLSNACNTNWCKKNIKWFEVVNSITCSSAAIRRDDKTFWYDNDVNRFIAELRRNGI